MYESVALFLEGVLVGLVIAILVAAFRLKQAGFGLYRSFGLGVVVLGMFVGLFSWFGRIGFGVYLAGFVVLNVLFIFVRHMDRYAGEDGDEGE